MIDPMHEQSTAVNRLRNGTGVAERPLSYSRLAIYLLPLLLLVVMLIYGLGEREQAVEVSLNITVLEPGLEFALVGGGDSLAGDAGVESIRAPSAAIRAQVMQRLSRFHADYKQVAPSIRVTAIPGDSHQRQLADTISDLLAFVSLNQERSSPDVEPARGRIDSAIMISASSQDRQMVYRLLQALSPLISGGVGLAFENSLSTGRVNLLIRGRPNFTAEGVAVFPAVYPASTTVPGNIDSKTETRVETYPTGEN